MGSTMHSIANNPSYQQGYVRSLDDERRISDIFKNRNSISPASPFGINNIETDNDLSIYPNRKSAFDQQIHSNLNCDLGRSSIRNPFDDINYLNFQSNSDNDRRLYKPLTVHNGLFEILSRPIFIHKASENKYPADFKFWMDPTKDRNMFTSHHQHQAQGYFNNMHKNHGIIMRPKQNELVTGSYDINQMSPTNNFANNFETDRTKISTRTFKNTYDIRNPGSLIFRGFDARVADKCK